MAEEICLKIDPEERISLHFKWREFLYSDTTIRHGIHNLPTSKEMLAIRELVKRLLQPLRIAYGKPIRISSGYRCAEVNRLVGGVPNSQHVKGEAADCIVPDSQRLVDILLQSRLPFDQAILYRKRGMLHLSLRSNGLNRKQILYK